jgi:hypothetical protein
MIEIARQGSAAFRSADEVLALVEPWAVINRATRAVLITCRIRRPGPTAKRPDRTLTARVIDERCYGDLAWVRETSGDLVHCGRWAHEAFRRADCREWTIAARLWPYLRRGVIPETVEIIADAAFVRDRRLRFQAEHGDVWQRLINPTKGAVGYNGAKLELVDRFGMLTDKELAKVRAQKSGRNWQAMDDREPRGKCAECGQPLALDNTTICRACQRRLMDGD